LELIFNKLRTDNKNNFQYEKLRTDNEIEVFEEAENQYKNYNQTNFAYNLRKYLIIARNKEHKKFVDEYVREIFNEFINTKNINYDKESWTRDVSEIKNKCDFITEILNNFDNIRDVKKYIIKNKSFLKVNSHTELNFKNLFPKKFHKKQDKLQNILNGLKNIIMWGKSQNFSWDTFHDDLLNNVSVLFKSLNKEKDHKYKDMFQDYLPEKWTVVDKSNPCNYIDSKWKKYQLYFSWKAKEKVDIGYEVAFAYFISKRANEKLTNYSMYDSNEAYFIIRDIINSKQDAENINKKGAAEISNSIIERIARKLRYIDNPDDKNEKISKEKKAENIENLSKRYLPLAQKKYLYEFREEVEGFTSDNLSTFFPGICTDPQTLVKIIRSDLITKDIPDDEKPFDFVIFDEASQITIEKALPCMKIARRYVVLGDGNQLPPDSYIINSERNKKRKEKNSIQDNVASLIYSDSLLSFFATNRVPDRLKFFYRSEYPELIKFNDIAFYNNEIKVSLGARQTDQRIFLHKCENATFNRDTRINSKEIDETIKCLKKLVKDSETKNICVILFNDEMKKELLNKINLAANSDIYDLVSDNKIFIKNAKEVQGDEYDDVIIVSNLVNAVDAEHCFPAELLIPELSKNYLNVIFSRAKKSLHLVYSFNTDELQEKRQITSLKDFAEFYEYFKAYEDKVVNDKTKSNNFYNTEMKKWLRDRSVKYGNTETDKKISRINNILYKDDKGGMTHEFYSNIKDDDKDPIYWFLKDVLEEVETYFTNSLQVVGKEKRVEKLTKITKLEKSSVKEMVKYKDYPDFDFKKNIRYYINQTLADDIVADICIEILYPDKTWRKVLAIFLDDFSEDQTFFMRDYFYNRFYIENRGINVFVLNAYNFYNSRTDEDYNSGWLKKFHDLLSNLYKEYESAASQSSPEIRNEIQKRGFSIAKHMSEELEKAMAKVREVNYKSKERTSSKVSSNEEEKHVKKPVDDDIE